MNIGQEEELLRKYLAGHANDQEQAIIESWYLETDDEGVVPTAAQLAKASLKVRAALPGYHTSAKKVVLWPRRMAVAALFLLAATAGILFYQYQTGTPLSIPAVAKTSLPGKVTLTLSDGKSISLSDAENGHIAQQNGAQITKTGDGNLVYSNCAECAAAAAEERYNTISVPRGSQYRLTLPDGSQVWLNAESSLKFPATFANLTERKVQLTGEGYFEVKHNAKQPFRVQSMGQVIEDLGTAFNVNSYPEEHAVQTTLVQGSVRISAGSQRVTLVPGQQASLTNGNISTSAADIEKTIAWKEGAFFFKDDELPYILRQLSRWYNVDVVYQGDIPAYKYNGQASRKLTLSQITDILRSSGVEITLKNKTLIVESSK